MSCEPEELSFLFLLFYIQSSGGMAQLADGEGGAQTWRLRGGAQQLSEGLCRIVRSLGGTLMLGRPVRGISQDCEERRGGSTEQATVAPAGVDQHQHQETLTREGGYDDGPSCSEVQLHLGGSCPTTLHAGRVVLAMPPPVWSRTINFHPPLPEKHAELGQNMFMGCAVKCVFLFRTAFWAAAFNAAAAVGGTAGETDQTAVQQLPRTPTSAPAASDGSAPGEIHQRPPAPPTPGYYKAGGQRLEELGPIANLFPSCIAGRPALVGIVTASRAQAFRQLTEGEQREAALKQVRPLGCGHSGESVGRREGVMAEDVMMHYVQAGLIWPGWDLTTGKWYPTAHTLSRYLRCRSRHTSAIRPWEPSWSTLWLTALRMSSAGDSE